MSNESTAAKRKADAAGPPKKRLRMDFAETFDVIAVNEDAKPLRTFVVHKDLIRDIGEDMRDQVELYGPLKCQRYPESIAIYLNWLYDKNLDIAKHAFVKPSDFHMDRHSELAERKDLSIGRIAGLFDLWCVGAHDFRDDTFSNKVIDTICGEKWEHESEELLLLLVDALYDSIDGVFWHLDFYDGDLEPSRWLVDVLAGSLSADGLRAIIRSDKLGEKSFTKVLTEKMVEASNSKPIDSQDYHV